MKIKQLEFGKEKIILPKEIEVEFEDGDNNARAMWKTINALVREYEQDQKKLKVFEIIKENLNIDEVLLAIKGVCKTSDYDLAKEMLL